MFTPSSRAYDAIRRVAAVANKPVSSVVSEQVDLLAEHLENLATILEEARRMYDEEPEAVVAAARAAFEQMLPILDRTEGELTGVLTDFDDQLSLLDAAESAPPPSNTGATSISGPPTRTPRKGPLHAAL